MRSAERGGGATVQRETGSVLSDSDVAAANFASGGLIPQWNQAVLAWLCRPLVRLRERSGRFEEALHQFAAAIAIAADSSVVEAALLRLARQLAPSSRVELIPVLDSESDDAVEPHSDAEVSSVERCAGHISQLVVDVPLRAGGSVGGLLRVRSRTGRSSPLASETVRRLTTICSMAACAMESLGRQSVWLPDSEQHPGDSPRAYADSRSSESSDSVQPSISLHDATFLNAVLPFALNQARRHRESLSLLCVAIDRLSGIQELLGRAEAKRLVRHVGETIGSVIRASDIVAGLDDDRVVAVLPRAPRGGALHVAEKVCRVLAETRPTDCETPRITVSIGVATFPSCADNVYSLFDAADEAQAWAQNHGRNQAILAPPRRAPASAHADAVPS